MGTPPGWNVLPRLWLKRDGSEALDHKTLSVGWIISISSFDICTLDDSLGSWDIS